MAPFHDSHGRTFIRHPNGQTTHYTSTPCASPSPHTTTILIAAEIIDTLDQLALPAVHFLGESTSGMLALALAASHPARLLSVTLCASPTHLPPAAQEFLAFGAESWPAALREYGARGWAERLARVPGTVVAPPGGEEGEKYVEWWKGEIGKQSKEGLAGYAGFVAGVDVRGVVESGEVARGGVPVLVLAPARSAAVRVEEAAWLGERVPRARVVVVEGGGMRL